jgi:hypothetical protein
MIQIFCNFETVGLGRRQCPAGIGRKATELIERADKSMLARRAGHECGRCGRRIVE